MESFDVYSIQSNIQSLNFKPFQLLNACLPIQLMGFNFRLFSYSNHSNLYKLKQEIC